MGDNRQARRLESELPSEIEIAGSILRRMHRSLAGPMRRQARQQPSFRMVLR